LKLSYPDLLKAQKMLPVNPNRHHQGNHE